MGLNIQKSAKDKNLGAVNISGWFYGNKKMSILWREDGKG